MAKEITINENDAYRHFSKLATKYRNLRITDVEPILYIKNKLKEKSKISLADVGCGDGRYSLKLLQSLGKNCYLYCVDPNENMLTHLKDYLSEYKFTNFCIKKGYAEKLPLKTDSMDCVVTFNTLNHIKLKKFLDEVSRCLVHDGILFVYTRLRDQNLRNIWGKYFPSFNNMGELFYEFDELKHHIQQANMKVHSSKVFGFHRTSSLDILVDKAQNKYYSTFDLYSEKMFEECLEKFQKNLKENFRDLEKIKWLDEYMLLEIRR